MSPEHDTTTLRQRLYALDDPAFDAFCLDHYSAVYEKFSRGMSKDEKSTCFLDYCRRQPDGLEQLTSQLSEFRPQVIEDYLAAVRDYCAHLPYLTLHDIRPPRILDEVYVPLQARPQPRHDERRDTARADRGVCRPVVRQTKGRFLARAGPRARWRSAGHAAAADHRGPGLPGSRCTARAPLGVVRAVRESLVGRGPAAGPGRRAGRAAGRPGGPPRGSPGPPGPAVDGASGRYEYNLEQVWQRAVSRWADGGRRSGAVGPEPAERCGTGRHRPGQTRLAWESCRV